MGNLRTAGGEVRRHDAVDAKGDGWVPRDHDDDLGLEHLEGLHTEACSHPIRIGLRVEPIATDQRIQSLTGVAGRLGRIGEKGEGGDVGRIWCLDTRVVPEATHDFVDFAKLEHDDGTLEGKVDKGSGIRLARRVAFGAVVAVGCEDPGGKADGGAALEAVLRLRLDVL